MKLSIYLLLLSVINVFASKTYSQTTELNINMKNSTVKEVLKNIENQSEFVFMYSEKLINVNREISVTLKNHKINEILDNVFAGTDVNYMIKDRFILLTTPEVSGDDFPIQQQRIVTGKVIDSSSQPLPGVTVIVLGTTIGTVTNEDGTFSLSIPNDAEILNFSFVGMQTKEIPISESTTFSVVMEEETIGIDEVIAVGYGTQKKVNMTGSVSSVRFDEVANSRPITNVSSALSGLSSGVYVKQGDGKPGSDGATIRVRGIGTLNNSNPLVIVDGMEGNMDDVNPQDIESISILKDAASSSIYGSRAANGVILITTKKGDGKKLNIAYNNIFSVAQPVNMLDFISDYPTYMRLMNESASNIGSAEIFSNNTINAWEEANKDPNALNDRGIPNYVAFPNTDWNEEVYRNALLQDHSLSLTGSSDNARFLLSTGYLDNPGLVDNTGVKRYSIRSNVEIDVQEWLRVGTRTYGSMTTNELGNYSNVLTYIVASTPGAYGMYNGQYGYPEAPEETSNANNVLAALNTLNGENRNTKINTTLYSEIDLFKGLEWDFNFNYNKSFTENNSYTNPSYPERYMFSNGEQMAGPIVPAAMVTNYTNGSSYYYTLENLLRYNTTIAGKHDISSLLGYNETYHYSSGVNASKRGLVDENVYVFDAATEMISIGGTASDWSLRSYFGRLNYNFDQRYLLEANLRYDGSSRFSKESRFGIFPSFSVGWRLTEEEFMENSNIFQNLKIRASWGKLGNNASGNYDSQALYSAVDYSMAGNIVTGLRPGKISNHLLMWESTSMTNIGLDALVFGGKLAAELDVYNKITDGILTTPPIYLTLGLVGAPTVNAAEVTNKGLELNLVWRNKLRNINYSISGNVAYNENKVTGYKGKLIEEWRFDEEGNEYYYSNLGDVSSGGQTRVLEDHIINEHFLYNLYEGDKSYFNSDGSVNLHGGPIDGMIRTEQDMEWLNAMINEGYQFMPNLETGKNKIWYGDYIYADINEDGIYGNSYDRQFTGSSNMPKITFGSVMNFNWQGFDLGLIWSGQAGVDLYWLEYGYNKSNTRIGQAISKMIGEDHYYYNDGDSNDPSNNINGKYPRLKLNHTDNQNALASSRWLYNGSYIRLRNLTLGYTIPQNITNKINSKRIRLYCSFENLFTITSFPGLDPEMGGDTNYPLYRQIAFGTNITF